MDAQRVDHHKYNADERDEQNVHDRVRETLDVGADFLKFAERFAAALIFENAVGELERMANPIGINLRPEPLRNDVDVVVLEVLCHSRYERDADGSGKQQSDPTKEFI